MNKPGVILLSVGLVLLIIGSFLDEYQVVSTVILLFAAAAMVGSIFYNVRAIRNRRNHVK